MYVYSFEFPPFNFPERETGGRMLDEFLQSAAALLVCMAASPEGERAGIFSFAYPPSEFFGARDGGWGFRWIYTLGDCAFSMHASGAGGGAG